MGRLLLKTFRLLSPVLFVVSVYVTYTQFVVGVRMKTRLTPEVFAQRHRGEPPCLRWNTPKASPEEIQRVAEELVRTGASDDDIRELMGRAWADWAFERERPAHGGLSETDEYELAAVEGLSSFQSWMMRVLQGREFARSREDIEGNRERLRATYADRGQPVVLPRVRAIWERSPLPFMSSELTEALPRARTFVQLQRLAEKIQAEHRATGRWPQNRAALREAGVPLADLGDIWRRYLSFFVTEQGVLLESLGGDGMAGGTGYDEDLAVWVTSGEVRRSRPTSAELGCAPLQEKLAIPAAERDQLYVRAKEVGMQARFVPASGEGGSKGVAVLEVLRGSALERLGVCHGDVITTINGQPITDAEEAVAVLASQSRAASYVLTVRRDGAEHRRVIRVEGSGQGNAQR